MEGQSRDGEVIVFLLFSDIFVGRDEALMEGDKVMMGHTQVLPPLKPCRLIFLVLDPLL